MEEENITGYHGTKTENALKIKQKGFKESIDKYCKLYLGKGIYFYVKYEDTISWNIKKYKEENKCYPNIEELNENYSIIESKINVGKDNILDLDIQSNLKIFDELVKEFEEKLKSNITYIKARNKNGAIINILREENLLENVDMIARTIPETILETEIHSMNRIFRKVLCVKNKDIIKTISIKNKVTMNEFEIINYFVNR